MRRATLRGLGTAPWWTGALASCVGVTASDSMRTTHRVRPADAGWPSATQWRALGEAVGGRLIDVHSPFAACVARNAECAPLLRTLGNPYAIGDDVALTQTLGWVDAWESAPSVHAIAATSAADVAAAVTFARRHRLRIVVKGGGHSYQGGSNSADSLLVWTRPMSAITMHEAFVAHGCAGVDAPRPAVTIGAGALWMHVYDAVTTQGGRYVQGGGCATVGVAGLVQSGGFGSFSKAYGIAAAGLIEAEVVTADGVVRIANRCTHPDLFWALKGGGGGTFGIVTRVTLRARELPTFFGGVFFTVRAASDEAFRRLVAEFIAFYAERLFNPHWGEIATFGPDRTLRIAMVFQNIDRNEAARVWEPFIARVQAESVDFAIDAPATIVAVPARHFWDAEALRQVPGLVIADDRPGAPPGNVFWAATREEAGQYLHGYQSTWMPAHLLESGGRERLADALCAASRHWPIALHFNKGLAGAAEEARAAARATAMNPAVLEAFALAIAGAAQGPARTGWAGHEPDAILARRRAASITGAMQALRREAGFASYVAESNFFEPDWQRSFWGENYPRLAAIKARYDPDGLFYVRHGVGSESWSADGFTRLR